MVKKVMMKKNTPAEFSEEQALELDQMSHALQEMMVKIQSTGHAFLDRASAQMGDVIYNMRKFLRDKKLEAKTKKTQKQTSLVASFHPKP